jgi:tetratricopeptide (TPR) repeat protein
MRIPKLSQFCCSAACVALTLAGPSQAAQCRLAPDLERAKRMIKAGLCQNALDVLQHVEAVSPKCDPDQYLLLAAAWSNLKSAPQALDAAERGTQAFPAFLPMSEYYVALLATSATPVEALPRMERALRRAPDRTCYQKALGKALLELSPESDRAGVLLSQVVLKTPKDVEARCLYAQWLVSARREEEALRQLDIALPETEPGTNVQVSIYRLRASAEEGLNRFEAARESLLKAVELNRGSVTPTLYPRWELAQFLVRRADEGAARKELDQLLAESPSFGPARFALARILVHAGEWKRAIDEAHIALERAPGVAEQKPIRAFLSKTCHAAGLEQEARVHEEWIQSH